MTGKEHRSLAAAVWALTATQHGVVARWQLLDLGASPAWIEHRIANGRLHPVHRGVYAVGRPELTQQGRWMAAVLACGRDGYLSHQSAAQLWRMLAPGRRGALSATPIHVSLNADVVRRRRGIRIYRRPSLDLADLTTHANIPVTSPVRTLVDLATVLGPNRLEAAVNEACVLDLTDPDSLRAALEERKGQPGVPALRALLDRHTFRLTDSELERRFLGIVRRAGLPLPETQVKLAGRVDFVWSELGLVVETDGWRYHRTPSQQARDNRRMQAHARAGRTAVRFSHYEIRYEPAHVQRTIAAVLGRRAA
jgi:very-short-patch-repair endonuclease